VFTEYITDVTPFHGNLGPTNRTLIGREDILEQLESLLSEGANRLIASNHLSASETTAERFKMAIRYINSLSKQQNIILEGDNGIGKTEVALSLSNEMRRTQDWTILWIHAQDEKSIRASYTQILRHLGRPVAGDDANDREILTLLYHLTWNFAGRWMMILDGLDAPGAAYLRLANMLPSGHRGTLIFTTAYPRLGRLFGPAKVIKVPPLDNDAALQLFIAARGKPLSPEELPLAAEVAGGVDGVPLAIIEAALQPL
jgi:DNA polymerase III delta prime subunit